MEALACLCTKILLLKHNFLLQGKVSGKERHYHGTTRKQHNFCPKHLCKELETGLGGSNLRKVALASSYYTSFM